MTTKYEISGIARSAKWRFVFINEKMFREGQTLGREYRIRRIGESEVELSDNGGTVYKILW